MPFGAMFGAVVFAVLCVGWGGRLVPDASSSHGVVSFFWAALGVILPLGLLLRQAWSRWLGIAAAVLLALMGVQLVLERGDVLDHLVLLAALVAGVLLAVPATGDLRRARRPGATGWLSGSLALTATGLVLALAFLCLPGVVSSSFPDTARAPRASTAGNDARDLRRGPAGASTQSAPRANRPASSGESVAWASFGSGARRAKSENRPMFVDFYATWCGVCKMMDRQTFRDPEVVRALGELVPVRVDSEDETARDGFKGSDLAERHAIRGYPTLVLFDAEGREISRRAGFLEPRAFLAWLDSSLRSRRATRASAPDGLRAGR